MTPSILPINFLDKSQWRTFDDWSKDQYQIRKGSKATKYNGVNYFHKSQVKDCSRRHGYVRMDDSHWDMDAGWEGDW